MSARRTRPAGEGTSRLRWSMLAFFLALATPTAVLVSHAYGQLKWEAFHQHRQLAEGLARRVDRRVQELLADEEARGFADYGFLVTDGTAPQRSPLSAFPVRSAIPGLLGWFQVDPQGTFSTPLLPPGVSSRAAGLNETTIQRRAALESHIRSILDANRLVSARPTRATSPRPGPAPGDAEATLQAVTTPAEPAPEAADEDAPLAAAPAASIAARPPVPAQSALLKKSKAAPQAPPEVQAAFDRLKSGAEGAPGRAQGALGRVEALNLSSPYAAEEERVREDEAAEARLSAGKEQARRQRASAALREPFAKRELARAGAAGGAPRIHTFESEVEPFELSLLDSGHLVLYRSVWRDGGRYIQGALIEQRPFLADLVEDAFQATTLARTASLLVAWRGDVLAEYSGDAYRSVFDSAEDLDGALLYRTRLSNPLADLELVFSVNRLPAGPGAAVLGWSAAVLALVLVTGTWLMYRLGLRQIALARQQQDFVSAVSHELRTPITSIRMYAEMLREGWASEEKKRGYYDFIVQESERLSRLIANVLQLARMSRNELSVQLRDAGVAQLLDAVRSQVASQVEHAGFQLSLECAGPAAGTTLRVDPDAFSQCVINLVDNAIKFSAGAERRQIDVGCRLDPDGWVHVTVRDYGPGVARDQKKKIFRLFYRSGNELTRETVGTGIGLALVDRLVRAMHGRVDVADAAPGALFTLSFPAAGRDKDAAAAG